MGDFIIAVLREFGVLGGMFVLFFLGAHWWIYRIYEKQAERIESQADKRVADRERENIRVIAENERYRDRFMGLIGKMGSGEESR